MVGACGIQRDEQDIGRNSRRQKGTAEAQRESRGGGKRRRSPEDDDAEARRRR